MNNSPDLSKWNYNIVLGLGTPDWCTKIRELREYERLEKKLVLVKYWQIDKEIKKEMEEKAKQDEKNKMNAFGGFGGYK